MFIATFTVGLVLLSSLGISEQSQQQPPSVAVGVVCTVDLSKPGQMRDIVSNALHRGLGKAESDVQEFLTSTTDMYATGHELAIAAAKAFNVDEELLFAKIEEFKHCNCKHADGDVTTITVGNTSNQNSAVSNSAVSDFAENVLLHVVLHVLGHGLVREFDLPILGNEETLADAFATHYAVTHMPDRAMSILEARVTSLMIEAGEVPRAEWTVKGEHNSDARRAYQIAAIAIAHDPQKYGRLAAIVNMDDSQRSSAIDYGAEIHRSWRRILRPLMMPDKQLSNEARVVVEDESIFAAALTQTSSQRESLVNEIGRLVRSFDWHSQVTVSFASGEGGAGWNRSRRTITIHDEYIERFNRQGELQKAQSAR